MAGTIEYLDQPPAGWFALDVMKGMDSRKWDWVALMIDVHPDELKEYRRYGSRSAQEAWLRIPGKHRNKKAAWKALRDMLKTRH